jgi:hypothetical protein
LQANTLNYCALRYLLNWSKEMLIKFHRKNCKRFKDFSINSIQMNRLSFGSILIIAKLNTTFKLIENQNWRQFIYFIFYPILEKRSHLKIPRISISWLLRWLTQDFEYNILSILDYRINILLSSTMKAITPLLIASIPNLDDIVSIFYSNHQSY